MIRMVCDRLPLTIFVVVLVSVCLSGCKRADSQRATTPPAVTVSQSLQREVTRWDDYSGYLSAPETAIVSARVSGLIVEAPFHEGAIVHSGDLLFKLDPRPFKADFDNKKAAVAQAKAMADRTRADFGRFRDLLQEQVISQSEFDSAKASYQQSAASLSAAEAALETSRLNLEWSEVKAPITGRISRMEVTVGNLINGGSGQPTNLSTIVSIDPLYAYLNVPEDAALHYQQLAVHENTAQVAAAKMPCFLQLESETNFPHAGVIDFVDNRADTNTGTVQIRCAIPNPTMLLTPGMFTVTRLPASAAYQALLIPDVAINTDQNERYVLVVGENNVVQSRTVELGVLFGSLRSITKGLQPNEWVVIDGMQSARLGAAVHPRKASIPLEAQRALEADASGLPATEASPSNDAVARSGEYPREASK
jgi:multidrug efflux system membrane fusion protein